MQEIKERATEIRRIIIELAHRSKSPHVGSCLSCADLLASLYFSELRLIPWDKRDIFILSKGHAAMALYGALSASGLLTEEELMGYYQNDGSLPAHLDRFKGRGIEVSAGSLGHGFNMGIGIAYGFKKLGQDRKVFAIIGDGESQEGSIWEGAMFAPTMGVDNFTAILDYNNLQGYGRPQNICSYEPIRQKWESFGWHTLEVDGHDHQALQHAFAQTSHGKPRIIIARTVKGKGVSFMEDQLIWHYFIVTDEIREKALGQLK